ncbi:uncharacterized protein LOC124300886 isoform X1 [Neodiprion virginianus]|uniref:uncharacterized protein LOC124178163 isoform X1 n=1 Tax=Neodiprion fabricii TaxID=2872261 RepID=UPI001ED979D0|nr:uncharacterized protein LOC124178163 isoform X1 [Neodiprion fabricii]XP_046417311.1 uncharacterized protein LOC124178163 isoform X1 [Neodiprion fabricii]XP_046417312.1 uncharacterized protein LOC124178163 isoform X1 [Neodiprion fabricii]XP_046611314.1 uncharacterized protein LOC124300886 isoform X1 [Neodiprion virginianus]XP_046611315.1 uncharacterized protein LOC124300886 isoform X1 [Neodiprion virginianus]XP_046611316.1 uncharacterized protein LOC124300886 isoform X1 [Neodiprion virginian
MGCGQSKIGNIYPKNKKNKTSSKKNGSASIEQKNGNGNTKGSSKTNNNGIEVNRNEEQNGPIDIKTQAKKKPATPGTGPLLHQAEVSSSQVDFFKMLDEKIENGPDYDESSDAAARVERVSSLLRRWELASVTWSSVSELNASPSTMHQRGGRRSSLSNSRQSLSAKDREGMRNIIGGRPESAPIFVRNANRVDGLQDTHCPSPNMPRHVLESISQSPTQSQKNTPPGTSPTCFRYGDYNAGNQSPPVHHHQHQHQHHHLTEKIGAKLQYKGSAASGNGAEFITTPHQLYREQYLQQTGIITMPNNNQFSAGSGNSVIRSNPYVQQYQINQTEHFGSPRKRGFNAAQMT